MDNQKIMIYDLEIEEDKFLFASSIESAIYDAEQELNDLEKQLAENVETIKTLTSECDKTDYALAVSSGILCGMIDIFLVGKPGESPVGEITDTWFDNRIQDFAKTCCPEKDNSSVSLAIKNLEKKFKIPYDQRGAGDIASDIFEINPSNHHFKSLAHNPTICGFFFSVLDQFSNTSHFVTGGELISLQDAAEGFELCGSDVPSKLFCAFVNWFGHLLSDVSGSSGSKGRGMGIPSPIWAWTNDVVALKNTMHIPVTEFDKSMNDLALKIYKEGFDARFQTAQAIPVFMNEIVVRLLYSVRRLIKYMSITKKEERSFRAMWNSLEPFTNATVKRMLTVAHGTFCMIDIGDATIHGLSAGDGAFHVSEYLMRLNIIGVGRFAVSIFGEVKRGKNFWETREDTYYITREKVIVADYLEGLHILADIYDDQPLLTFIDDFHNSKMYKEAFQKSVTLAEKRNVDENEILRTKSDIDFYFRRRSQDE